jgi:hypothetical protein
MVIFTSNSSTFIFVSSFTRGKYCHIFLWYHQENILTSRLLSLLPRKILLLFFYGVFKKIYLLHKFINTNFPDGPRTIISTRNSLIPQQLFLGIVCDRSTGLLHYSRPLFVRKNTNAFTYGTFKKIYILSRLNAFFVVPSEMYLFHHLLPPLSVEIQLLTLENCCIFRFLFIQKKMLMPSWKNTSYFGTFFIWQTHYFLLLW